MPRDLLTDPVFDRLQDARYRCAFVLEVDTPAGLRVYSDHPWFGRPIVRAWGQILPLLAEDEMVPEAQRFDCTLSNRLCQGSRAADDFNDPAIRGVECRLYIASFGATEAANKPRRLVFSGKLQDVGAATATEIAIGIDGRAAYYQRTLSKLVGDTYPQAPPSSITRLQPLWYGRVPDVPALPIDVGVVGELESAIASDATSFAVKEDIGRWPSSGIVQLGGTTLASYSGKDEDTNEITGLVMGLYGTPVSAFAAGTVVIQRPSAFKFLLLNPDYGPLFALRKVRIAGVELSSSRWSVDRATGVLTVQPYNRTLGRPTFSRSQLVVRGFIAPGSPLAQFGTGNSNRRAQPLTGIRVIADNLQTRPITHCAHSTLVPWNAPSAEYFWPIVSDTSPSATDKLPATSTVKLMPNTPKTWSGAWFSSYLPPTDLFVRTGVTINAAIVPAMRRAWAYQAGVYEMKTEPVKLVRIDCTINGVTKSWTPSGDDSFGAPQLTGTTASLNGGRAVGQQFPEWPFSAEEVDPYGELPDVTLEAITGDGIVSHVCRVQSLTMSIDGVLPWTAPTGCSGATLSHEAPVRDKVTLTFDETFGFAVFAIAFRAACDYVKVDFGGGRVVRFQPSSLDDGILTQADITGTTGVWLTATVIVQNPGATVTVEAKDLGDDGSLPAERGASTYLQVGGATLTGLSAGSDTYPLLRDASAESAWELTFGPYPTVDLEGYQHRTSLELIERPHQAIRHYLTEVMGEPSADVDVDEDQFVWPSYYRLAGGIVEATDDIRLPLVRMARASRARLWWDAFFGFWRMRYRKSPSVLLLQAPDHEWGPADFLPGDVALEPPSDSDLPTKINVRYLRNWNLAEDLDSYAQTEPSGSGTRTADERYAFDFVRSKQMAVDLAAFYAAWDTVATRRCAVVALPKHLDADVNDVVSLTLPIPGSDPAAYVQGVNATKFLLEAPGLSPHDVTGSTPTTVPALLREIPT